MNRPFLHFLQELRFETIHLAHQWQEVDPQEKAVALDYLHELYQKEALEHPHQTPEFDPAAAAWGALLLYYAAQAILNRSASLEEIMPLFESYTGQVTASAVFSVDLSLRFLPDLIDKLKIVNPDDGLILLLEQQLAAWPYSAIGYELVTPPPLGLDNPCLLQCYANRIIAKKAVALLSLPVLYQAVQASLGAHQKTVWPDLDLFVDNALG